MNKPNGTLTGMKNIHLYTHSNTHIHRYMLTYSDIYNALMNKNHVHSNLKKIKNKIFFYSKIN